MKAFLVNLVLFCSFTSSSHDAVDSRTVKAPVTKPARVGQIFIIGNDRTEMMVILHQVPFFPGMLIDWSEIRQSEKNLARLGIFKCSPDGVVRPWIEVRNNPNNPDSEYKDVYIHLQETDTGRACLKHGFNSKGDWVFRLVVEERNLDPLNFPTSSDDFKEGRAFRGAGLAIGGDFQLTVPFSPISKPFVTLTGRWPVCAGR